MVDRADRNVTVFADIIRAIRLWISEFTLFLLLLPARSPINFQRASDYNLGWPTKCGKVRYNGCQYFVHNPADILQVAPLSLRRLKSPTASITTMADHLRRSAARSLLLVVLAVIESHVVMVYNPPAQLARRGRQPTSVCMKKAHWKRSGEHIQTDWTAPRLPEWTSILIISRDINLLLRLSEFCFWNSSMFYF